MWLATSSLESYVHDLLRRYVGKFVDVPREGLSFSIWAGEGVLEGVSVRPDALSHLPLRVIRGRVARIRIFVPWHALRSVPVTIRVEGLALHVEAEQLSDELRPVASRNSNAGKPAECGKGLVGTGDGRSSPQARDADRTHRRGPPRVSHPGKESDGSSSCHGRLAGGLAEPTQRPGVRADVLGGANGRSGPLGRKRGGPAVEAAEAVSASNGTISRYLERMAALILSNMVLEVHDAVVTFGGIPTTSAAATGSSCCAPSAGCSAAGDGTRQRVALTALMREFVSSPADVTWSAAFVADEAGTATVSRRRIEVRGVSLRARLEDGQEAEVEASSGNGVQTGPSGSVGVGCGGRVADRGGSQPGGGGSEASRADSGPSRAAGALRMNDKCGRRPDAVQPASRFPAGHSDAPPTSGVQLPSNCKRYATIDTVASAFAPVVSAASAKASNHTTKASNQPTAAASQRSAVALEAAVGASSVGCEASIAPSAAAEEVVWAVRVQPPDGQASWAAGGEAAVARARAAAAETECASSRRVRHEGRAALPLPPAERPSANGARIPGADPARESAGGVGTASMGSDVADDSRFGSLVCELDTTILLEQVDAASRRAGSAPEPPLDSSIQRLWMWVPAGVEACIRDSVWRDVQASVKTLWASMRPAVAPAALFDGRTLRSSQQSTVGSHGAAGPSAGHEGSWSLRLLEAMPGELHPQRRSAFACAPNGEQAVEARQGSAPNAGCAGASGADGALADLGRQGDGCDSWHLTETDEEDYFGISSSPGNLASGAVGAGGVCVHLEVQEPHHDERAGRAAADEARTLARLTVAIRTAPDDPSSHYARASKLLALGLFAEAARDAATCLELDPRHAKAHLARGRALYSLGEYRVAFRHYEAGLELAPQPSLSAWLAREMPRPEYCVAQASAAALRRRVHAAVSASDTQALTLLLQRCERSSLLPKTDGGLRKSSAPVAASCSTDEGARSALHMAAANGHTDCVVLLLRHGVPATNRDEHGHTPLMAALIASNVDAALALMPPPLAALPPAFLQAECESEPPVKSADGVHAACGLGRTALHLAAARGLLSCISRLLDAGADVRARDERMRTPLHFASAAGQGLALGQLVARESGRAGIDDLDADGCTPALLAARTAYSAARTRSPCSTQIAQLVHCVSLCVLSGAYVDTAPLDDGRLIHYAAALGAQDALALLLSRSADVGAACTTDGALPLHFAAAHGQPSSVRMLLAAGAQADAPDVSGLIPLEYALRGSDGCTPHEGHAACHELLLRHLAR